MKETYRDEAAININDPRAKRTRQLLLQALVELAAEQNLNVISVQAIAARAGVNRATFYAHFEDKAALIEAAMRDAIQQALEKKLQVSSPFNQSNLCLLICAVAEMLRSTRNQCRGPNYASYPLVEAAVQRELYAFILLWLQLELPAEERLQSSLELIATLLSWAIFGTSLQWSREPQDCTVEEMAKQLMPLLLHGVSSTLSHHCALTHKPEN
ncbi:MAG: TetR/AcrR family transcriptional regulator [Stenomitos rutilans HA7619-LM2]|nr:TetR/AcrR family transcriptional regulator [Stenomitos rutilans HA7619-LM2]